MLEKDVANHFEASDEEEVIPEDWPAPNMELIQMRIDQMGQTLKENMNPVVRLNNSILKKYEMNPLTGEIVFGESKEGKRDQSIYLIAHSLVTAKTYLELIATDNNLSSVDLKQYGTGDSRSLILSPSQLATNCLSFIERIQKEIAYPSHQFEREFILKNGFNEDGYIQFDNSEKGKRNSDIGLVVRALSTARLALELIMLESEQAPSSDVNAQSAIALNFLGIIKQILNGAPTSKTLA